MRKIYSLMAMLVVSLLAFQASAYSITLEFDNPNAIKSITAYSDYSKTVIESQPTPAASVVAEYNDDSTILEVVAADGYALNECVYTTPTSTNNYFQNSYKDYHDIYLSSGYDGAKYTYKTVNMNELRTNTAKVTVNGDVSKVALQLSGTYMNVDLQQGENTVKFMDSESTFYISPKVYGQSLCSVSLNGAKQPTSSSYSTSWTLTVANGDEIVIEADFPDVPCDVSFVFAEDGTEDYVTGVYINDVAVENWKNGFTANGGDNLYFTVDTSLYKLNDFQVNEETKNLYGSYRTTVEGDKLEFYFDVEPYGMCVAHVTVDNPERLQYRIGYSGSYEDVPSASFDVEVSESIASYTPVYFNVKADNCYIKSMVAGEYTISKNYDGSYSTNITDGMNITITTGEIVRDKTAYFYIHNPSDATDYGKSLYGYYFTSAFSTSGITLSQGYNKLSFGDVDNPYKFQVNGNLEYVEPMVWFYYNGVLTTHTDSYNGIWEMPYEHNDVIKVYIGEAEPEHYLVVFNMDNSFENAPEIVYDYVVEAHPVQSDPVMPLDEEESVAVATTPYLDQVLPGTHVIVKPNGNSLKVQLNESELTPDEDGNYSFDVNEETVATVLNDIETGIKTLGSDAAATRIFNLQGIEMKGDKLPAGIYIMNGRKVVVR